MKEALIDRTISVTIHDTPIPTPEANQVLIRVVVSGSNPKDWKLPKLAASDEPPKNQGDDIAGYVESVGPEVTAFKKGDKVAAFHQINTPHGSYAEYAIAWEHTTFHVPERTSFEEAATLPLASMTAALGMYQWLELPLPWNPALKQIPLVVYGGATAVGAFAIKFAMLSNIHPIIAVAGKGIPFVETLLDKSKGDIVLDYREGDTVLRQKIKQAAGGQQILYAYDAVSEKGSYENIFAVLDKGGIFTHVLPISAHKPDGIEGRFTYVSSVHVAHKGHQLGDPDFGAALFHFMGRGLAKGWFKGHPYEVRKGGLNGVEGLLKDLEAGKASAVKYVVRIGDTPGLKG
ncbi:Alcohol dehydrogenase GroES-like domain protein [Aspergillus sclerotialis]|uniref:Alcohol dehydrogenase GroES-like domain protein n=1 Tax=Aspergillus sclerotialis TaxID=2070753 RepID=A0A3A2ZRP6_9EURO|nr:Alcohol dehydrogenase GroES-like domain protein [Aspergillus sclerotialis]